MDTGFVTKNIPIPKEEHLCHKKYKNPVRYAEKCIPPALTAKMTGPLSIGERLPVL